MINLTGEVIKERYCILEQIGRGGNGQVYLAQDMELGCKWAVKVIEHWQRQEALILKELNHPFMPKMIDYEETEKYCFLIMEYIEGENLEDYLEKAGNSGKISEKECMKIILDIADILAYFHTRTPALIYGDMKPANLIRTNAGEIYLVDFGSVMKGYRDRPFFCQGTKGFAAPEQYDGKMTTASDVYAFGCTVKKILESAEHKTRKRALRRMIFRCCQRQEKYRYRNMQTVLEKLKRIKPAESFGSRIFRGLVLALSVLFGLSIGVMEMMKKAESDNMNFYEMLTDATDCYREDALFQRTGEFSNACCKEAENYLKDILQKCRDAKEQRAILRLLAVNAEYMREYRNAAFYYEQMLIYAPAYREGYGMYGLFLIRIGQKEESMRLYERYQDMEYEEENSENASYYFSQWETYIKGEKDE